MATKKYKRMTNREKEERKRIKKILQEDGILPPDKPRLNRKKFAQEVCDEWKDYSLGDYVKLNTFIIVLEMMTNSGRYGNISKEDLGILKLKKCAMVLDQKLQENGNRMTIEQITEVIEPIWKL
ncbi:addiction module toxin RelE [Eubacterium sp. TM05-53]|nr:addiction module toxin RelE [Eubacterium sp. TM05-53]